MQLCYTVGEGSLLLGVDWTRCFLLVLSSDDRLRFFSRTYKFLTHMSSIFPPLTQNSVYVLQQALRACSLVMRETCWRESADSYFYGSIYSFSLLRTFHNWNGQRTLWADQRESTFEEANVQKVEMYVYLWMLKETSRETKLSNKTKEK